MLRLCDTTCRLKKGDEVLPLHARPSYRNKMGMHKYKKRKSSWKTYQGRTSGTVTVTFTEHE